MSTSCFLKVLKSLFSAAVSLTGWKQHGLLIENKSDSWTVWSFGTFSRECVAEPADAVSSRQMSAPCCWCDGLSAVCVGDRDAPRRECAGRCLWGNTSKEKRNKKKTCQNRLSQVDCWLTMTHLNQSLTFSLRFKLLFRTCSPLYPATLVKPRVLSGLKLLYS